MTTNVNTPLIKNLWYIKLSSGPVKSMTRLLLQVWACTCGMRRGDTWHTGWSMYSYRQCSCLTSNTCIFTDSAYSKNSDNTQNTVLKKWTFAHLHTEIQTEELPKIAYIPEKEHNYLSLHHFDTSPFLCGMRFLQNKMGLATADSTTLLSTS